MRIASWAFMLMLAAALGCGSKEDSNDDPWSGSGSGDEGDGSGSSPAGMDFGMLGAMLGKSMEQPGPYEAPRQSPGYTDGAPHVAVLDLSGSIVELRSFSLFGGAGGTELRALLDRFAALGDDEAVPAVILRVGDLSMSMAHAEEVRGALLALREDGKRLWCHTERADSISYYLMTACEQIGLAPTGELVVSGVAAMPVHAKGMLDKLGVRADFLHIGAFKGAAEPLTRDAPSPEMQKTLGAILDHSYQTLVTGIATGRGLDETEVRARIDTALFADHAALRSGLVDHVETFEAFRSRAAGEVAWKNVELAPALLGSDPQAMMRFIGMLPTPRPSAPHVALVYAVGGVVDGDGEGVIGARSEIASRTLSAAIRVLAADASVRAIVLRVDSGGGSALASELIWHAVSEARAAKPVVVSMAGVAASGGYYIGCGASKVFASASTLTGSIGVVGGKIAIGEALADVGVRTYPMGRGKRALIYASMEPWTPDERAAVKTSMEAIYDRFLERVAEGRSKSKAEIHEVAQGRVWTGQDALARGLVDELGGLRAALATAHELAGLPADAPLEVYPPEPTLRDLLGSLSGADTPLGAASLLGELARVQPELAVVARRLLAQVELFVEQPVQAVALLPFAM